MTIAARYRQALHEAADGRLTEFDLTPYDRTGVPVAATVWDDAAGDAHGVGYGGTREQAEIGALGELAERVLMRPALQRLQVRKASYADLVAQFGRDGVADPVALIVDADADYAPDRPVHWVPAQRWRTGEQVWVPAEFAAFDPGSVPGGVSDGLITPITNGMGAGDTLERAVGHGLLELLQRDGDNVRFRALDAGVVIDLSGSTDPTTVDTIETLRAVGIEPVVKLASTEFACVTYCVGIDEQPDTPVLALGAIGEAAHPDRDVSIAKSLLEFASSRARRSFAFGPLARVGDLDPDYLREELERPVGEQEPRALAEMTRWTQLTNEQMNRELAPIFRRTSTVAHRDLPSAAELPPAGVLDTLLDRLGDIDVLVVPSAPGSDEGGGSGMVTAKVLAPGLEVETMSYLRIGERALRQLLDAGSDLAGLGVPASAQRVPVRLTAPALERIGSPAWIDRAAVARAVDTLYPLYREPRRHAVQRAALGAR